MNRIAINTINCHIADDVKTDTLQSLLTIIMDNEASLLKQMYTDKFCQEVNLSARKSQKGYQPWKID